MEMTRALERMVEDFYASDVVREVFPECDENYLFISGLSDISKIGEVRAGGRRIRELMGCKTRFDYSPYTAADGKYNHDIFKMLRLPYLNNYLENYPERMTKPDLDFFTEGIPLAAILDILTTKGFDATIHAGSSGVNTVRVKGSNGMASFVDSNESWQTQPPWPMFGGISAKFIMSPGPKFSLDHARQRFFENPLELSGTKRINQDPLNPQRVAACARLLLWSITASNPLGEPLEVPGMETQKAVAETTKSLFGLLEKINLNPDLGSIYSGALRDFSMALRIIELTDWYEDGEYYGFSPEHIAFFGWISSSWLVGRRTIQSTSLVNRKI